MKVLASASLGVLLLLLCNAMTHAQAADPMTITFVRPSPEYRGVEAFIGTTLCASVDFDETLAMEVGGPGAPGPCSEPGRVIELVVQVEEHRSTMFTTPVFEPGASLTIRNFGPFPAVDGPDVHFGIEIDARELSMPEREAIGSLSAYVNGTLCGSTSLVDLESERPWLSVSPREGPVACREEGAAIRLVQADGRILRVSPTVGVGPFYTLDNFELSPHGHGPAAPIPASAGHGGWTRSPSVAGQLALAGLGFAIVALARRNTRPRTVA